jgi:hypothetical protein
MRKSLIPMTLNAYSEYYRVCAYCGDTFMANHLLRKFCQQKFGVPDFCKNRFKVLKATSNLVQPLANDTSNSMAFDNYTLVEHSPPAAVAIIPKADPIQIIDATERAKNIASLNLLLAGEWQREISFEEMDSMNYKLDVYDALKPIRNTSLSAIEIGPFTLIWDKKNDFLLTLTTEVLWM